MYRGVTGDGCGRGCEGNKQSEAGYGTHLSDPFGQMVWCEGQHSGWVGFRQRSGLKFRCGGRIAGRERTSWPILPAVSGVLSLRSCGVLPLQPV